MNILDTQTILISYVITNAICAMGMFSLWLRRHKLSPGLGFWLADFIMQFLALLLIALRGRIPDLLSMVGGSTLVVAGTLVLYIGLERYVGKRSSQLLNYLLLAAFICVHTWFSLIQPSLLARNINLSLGVFMFCLQCTWLMLQRVGPELRDITRSVGVIFGLYCVVSVARIATDLVVPPGHDILTSGLYDTLALFIYQMFFIALTLALLLMRNRRLVAELERDILNRQAVESKLRYSGTHDALTGLYNRGFFEEELARLEQGRRFPVSILMADVDDLKVVNDEQGHAAGDELLKQAGRVLGAAFRVEDTFARIGGDEFAVLLPDTTVEQAEAVLCRARSIMDENNRPRAGAPLRMSFGLSTAEDGAHLAPALREADERMYEEKRSSGVVRKDERATGS